jgi:hypothetical protein
VAGDAGGFFLPMLDVARAFAANGTKFTCHVNCSVIFTCAGKVNEANRSHVNISLNTHSVKRLNLTAKLQRGEAGRCVVVF